MTQIAAICKALLEGKTLSIMDGYKLFACSNLPREISRGVEKTFQVSITREHVKFTSRYGQGGHYFRYRLNPLREGNHEGMIKMWEYVKQQESNSPAKTNKEEKTQKAISQTLNAINYQSTQLPIQSSMGF